MSLAHYFGRWHDEESDTELNMKNTSRYFLPVLHLVRRLAKGPYEIRTVEMFGTSLFIEPRGSTRALSFNTRIQGDTLYEHSTEKVALAIERSFRKQIENTNRIINTMKRR